MTAFADAVDVLFEDPNLSEEAVWTSHDGSPVVVRVLRRAPDLTTDFSDVRIVSETTVLEVRVADLAQPKEGDVVAIGPDTFLVQGDPMRDSRRLRWKVSARPTN